VLSSKVGKKWAFHFFLNYSDSSRTLVKRNTGAGHLTMSTWCSLSIASKVIRIHRFLSSIVSRNIVALGGKKGEEVGSSNETHVG